MANRNWILGIDLGGTKCAACLGSVHGEIYMRETIPTPEDGGMLLASLIDLATRMQARAAGEGDRLVGVGVSAGAPADAVSGVVFDAPNLPKFPSTDGAANGVPLAQMLSHALGGLPVALENDADATALAEHRFGAGVGVSNMAFLTMGTGIGSGLILDGKLHRGAQCAGGEIGHIAVEPGGRECLCGLRGCLEAYASGPSIVRVAIEMGFVGNADGRMVVDSAREGDAIATFALQQAGVMLGRGLATLCMLLNLELIVLGTLAVHAGDLLLPIVDRTMRDSAWPRLTERVVIVPAALGDRAQDLAAICAFLDRDQS